MTVCIDKVAASGGLHDGVHWREDHQRTVRDLGSIGVVAQLPNVNRLLKKHDIDF
ncbi:MAG: hypothetical protein LKM38_03525 [Pseudomonas veronii]|nr:hypothetical protein [Pseudomonas veronii]